MPICNTENIQLSSKYVTPCCWVKVLLLNQRDLCTFLKKKVLHQITGTFASPPEPGSLSSVPVHSSHTSDKMIQSQCRGHSLERRSVSVCVWSAAIILPVPRQEPEQHQCLCDRDQYIITFCHRSDTIRGQPQDTGWERHTHTHTHTWEVCVCVLGIDNWRSETLCFY